MRAIEWLALVDDKPDGKVKSLIRTARTLLFRQDIEKLRNVHQWRNLRIVWDRATEHGVGNHSQDYTVTFCA